MPERIDFIENIKLKLKKKMAPERYGHSLNVAQTAFGLALKENEDEDKAYLAGLIHDLAKVYNESQITKFCELSEWEIDDNEWLIPQVLHAPAGAYLAKKEFGIEDYQILEAVRFHTIGHPGMDRLAKIIFVADYIEPGRNFPGVEKVRLGLEKSLSRAVFLACSQTISYNLKKVRLLHPNTVLLRNEYLRRTN